jgi:ATP-dependent RNA helicase DeaD
VVLDEADEMLDLGFLEDVETILSRCPSGRQTGLFSATMPTEIKRLAESRMFDPVTIKVRAATLTVDTVDQFFIEVSQQEKVAALADVLKAERPAQSIIFVRTKIGADRLARSLGDKGVRVKALHGDMSQGSRDGVMIGFKEGRERLLVATDIAARGLDISGVTHVINYDMPNSPELYVHRVGRTGRVGRAGRAITLVTPKQCGELDAIRRHANTEVNPWRRQDAGAPDHDSAAAAKRARADAAGGASAESPPPEAAAVERTESSPTDAPARPAREPRETRRPRHTKPRRDIPADGAKLVVAAGSAHGLEPADVIGAIVDHSHLDGEDISNVRVLERFSFVQVPRARAPEVAEKVTGQSVRGVELRLEVART